MTFWNLVHRAADEAPERVILADDHGRALTTRQFRDSAERVAAGLARPVGSAGRGLPGVPGVSPGHTVSWQLPTCLEALVLMAALARLDIVQNPVIPALRHREVRIVTNQLEPSLYIAPARWRGFAYAGMARELGCPVLALDLEGDPGPELRLPTGDPSSLPPPPAEDARWVYYSSGTTSDPKGVKHTDSSLVAAATGLVDHATFGDGDVYPIAWPVTHIGGVTMLATSLRAGLKLVLFDTWDPATTPERMATHRPTILGSAQPFFLAYLDAQRRHGDEPLFPDLRIVTAGGAPTPPEIVRELAAAFGVRGVLGSYGLTEFPIATATTPDDPEDVLQRSVGRPSPGVQVRVVDGEIRLKGPQRFGGYVDPALDAGAFDEEGWVRTGDLGEVDGDGNVYITGRLKDVIIRNAENISALEIEDVLLRHPDVADVAVIGLPDRRTGERVCAVIALRPDARRDPDRSPESAATLDVASVAVHCLANGLAKYKCPEQVEIVPALERNSMGKLLKQQLRERLVGDRAERVVAPRSSQQ
jgi:cyclohexanecarboxylate-CoA ligase